jgi:hypothetical protein
MLIVKPEKRLSPGERRLGGIRSEPAAPLMVRTNPHQFKSHASAKSRLLQLAIDAVRELVEAFVDADFLGDHLLK